MWENRCKIAVSGVGMIPARALLGVANDADAIELVALGTRAAYH